MQVSEPLGGLADLVGGNPLVVLGLLGDLGLQGALGVRQALFQGEQPLLHGCDLASFQSFDHVADSGLIATAGVRERIQERLGELWSLRA